MDVSVIIVNYNTCESLDNCLTSIKDHTQEILYEVIVVDNASCDGTKEMVRNKYPWVKLIESRTNIGFGRANNLGFEYSSGRHIFLLNSDTLLIENAIKRLSNVLDMDNSIGAVGAMLIGKDNRQVHSFGNFPSLMGKIMRKKFIITEVDFIDNTAVDYITGADLMLPRSVWLKLGGFDPGFFLYFEETDLQKRMASLGFKRILVPSTRIIHLEGGSTKNRLETTSINEWKSVIMFTSMMYYMKKHTSSLGFLFLKSCLLSKYIYLAVKRSDRNNYYKKLIDCIKIS